MGAPIKWNGSARLAGFLCTTFLRNVSFRTWFGLSSRENDFYICNPIQAHTIFGVTEGNFLLSMGVLVCQFRIQSVKGWAHTSHFFLNSRQKSMLGCEVFTIRECGSWAALGSWKVLTETPIKILVGSGLVRDDRSMMCFTGG